MVKMKHSSNKAMEKLHGKSEKLHDNFISRK